VVRHRHKENVVGLGGLGQDLLEAGSLIWSEAAADAILKVGAATRNLVTFTADVFLCEAGIDVAAPVP